MNENESQKMKRTGRRGILRYLSDRRGAMAVEFGMISMAFLTMVFGTIEGGRALWAKSALQSALDDTSRYALTHRDAAASTLQSYAQARMADIYADNTSSLAVTVTPSTVGGVDYLTFDGSYPFNTIIPFLPAGWSTMTLSGESKTPIPAVAYAPPTSSETGTGTGTGTGSGSGTGTSSGTTTTDTSGTTTSSTCAHGHSCQCSGHDR